MERASAIEVRVGGRGTVRDGEEKRDPGMEARCDLCAEVVDAVASMAAGGGAPFACKACLRSRLEAMTVAQWTLREPGEAGLPWGKICG